MTASHLKNLPLANSPPGEPHPLGHVAFAGAWRFWPGLRDPAMRTQGGLPPLQLKGAPRVGDTLAKKQVLLIGLGAINGRVLERLTQSGVGRLVAADPDRYEPTSCWTQPCSADDVGRFKASVQGERAHRAGPNASILTAATLAQNLPYRLLWDADAWVSAADNLEVMVWAGALATAMRKPLLQGAVFGEQWLAIVRHWDLRNAEHACPACGLSRAEWRNLRSRRGCDPGLSDIWHAEPTRTLPSVCGLAAEMLASKVLAYLMDRPGVFPAAEEWIHAAATCRVMATTLERNHDCRCPHTAWERIDLETGPAEVTLEQLARHLGSEAVAALGTPRLVVRSEIPWVHQAVDELGNNFGVAQFGRVGTRWRLQQTIATAVPSGVRSTLTSSEVQRLRDTPLSQLGLPSGAGIALECEDRQVWFFVGPLLLHRPCKS
jgi:hypothetical protein